VTSGIAGGISPALVFKVEGSVAPGAAAVSEDEGEGGDGAEARTADEMATS